MATGAALSGLKDLPVELIGEIVGNLNATADLSNIRLVLRKARNVTEPYLFDSVHLKLTTRSLENAKTVVRKYGKYVLAIHICPLRYKPYSQSGVALCNIVRRGLSRPINRRQEHFDLFAANYQRNERLTDKLLDSAQLGTQLLLALNKLPRLPRIFFTTKFNFRYTDVEWQAACPNPTTCNLTREEHKAFYPPPTKMWSFQDNGDKFIHDIFMNMFESDKAVKELIVPSETALCAGIFAAMTPWETTHAQGTFSQLTRLVLNFDPSAQENDFVSWHGGHVSGLLAGALNLEVFALNINAQPAGSLIPAVSEALEINIFEALLHNCRFPVLRNAYLGNMDATAPEIGRFLRGNPALRTLFLERFIPRDGLWREIAEDLKSLRTRGLRSTVLHLLCGGFEGFHWDNYWCNDAGVWETFFSSDGMNPFQIDPETSSSYIPDNFNANLPSYHTYQGHSYYPYFLRAYVNVE